MINLDEIKENFPFLSVVRCQEHEYVCIIQNCDDKIISFYDFESIRTNDKKKLFLELGDIWWWESNKTLPINIFLPHEMKAFRECLKTVTRKDAEVLFGPVTSLNNLIKKRIKKRQIQLVKKS